MSEKRSSDALSVTHSLVDLPELGTADQALKLALDGEKVEVTDEERRALVRKIDLHIMPLVCVIYFFQYLDKICISYASSLGIIADNGITTTQFSWVATIFFAGQLVFEFPSVYLLQRLPVAKFTSVTVFLWGGVLSCFAATTNFTGMMLVRLFLGICEASVVPAWVIITSQWYTKEQQGFRVGIWFSMCGFAQIFGGCMAYGISKHVAGDVNALLSGWQVVFLITGCITSFAGIILYFALPDSPVNAWFLSDRERRIHIENIRHNQQGVGNNIFKKEHFYEAIKDPNTWMYAFWVFAANIPNSLATSYGGIILTGLGYTKQESLVLVTPLGAVEVVVLLGGTWLGRKYNQRLLVCIVIHIIPIVGAFLLALGDKKTALAGYYLQGAVPIGWTVILGQMSSNVAGSTKKSVVNAINVIGYCAGNIISPQTFRAANAPRYLPAKISIIIIMFLVTIDLIIMRWYAIHLNKKRDAEREALGDDYKTRDNQEFLDLTDRENKEFRYVY
ncbi:unnamed protein product [Kuraishia capsulata CBS 1993]|uniref:Major facilitator superfamily (MFS) profile domain-containing protein n=1 Tax=Kuraishia capsulata CBS 1993 TaxID=1382522 RepID=W6ML40_9ASCO|nr:uncharacterized protein KUCA_T00003138001 [Kuraishia capsulata CBS 1993]CDK27161.1 unnamed protein product [Kuraishia capsulata CBS 1993]